jgi:HD superfamily phosphohydrolase
LDRNYVILNVSEYPSFDEMKTWVSFGENLYHLNEISSIVGALSSARFNSADIALYVPKEDMKKINRLKLDNYIDLPERVNKFDTIHFEQSTLF